MPWIRRWPTKDRPPNFDFDAYLAYYREKYGPSMRKAVVSVTTLWVLLFALDIYKDSVGGRKNIALTLSLRAAVTVFAVSGYLFYRKRVHLEVFTTVLLLCLGIVQMVFGYIEKNILDPTYSVVILFISTLSATYFRLRFFFCCAVMWSLFIIFILLTKTLDAYETDEIPSHRYWFTVVLMILGNLVYTYQAYDREYWIRRGFLAAKELVSPCSRVALYSCRICMAGATRGEGAGGSE